MKNKGSQESSQNHKDGKVARAMAGRNNAKVDSQTHRHCRRLAKVGAWRGLLLHDPIYARPDLFQQHLFRTALKMTHNTTSSTAIERMQKAGR